MKIWDKLSNVDIRNKERYVQICKDLIKKIQSKDFKLVSGKTEKEDYYIVIEENRMNSYFVHIVPKEVWNLFIEMQREAPNEFLGFSVMIGKYDKKEIRISCFGIPCSLLGNLLFKD